MPVRIQRLRVKGWQMPLLARYVGRPSLWGNPFIVGATTPGDWPEPFAHIQVRDRGHAVQLLRDYLAWRAEQPYGWHIRPYYPTQPQLRAVLHGRDLVCWCPLDQPCHADLLLELANREDRSWLRPRGFCSAASWLPRTDA